MKLTTKSNGAAQIFVAESSFAEKDIPKAAGFKFCWGKPSGKCWAGCKACPFGGSKIWWTDKKELAARLVQFADDTTKAAIAPAVEAVQASRAQDTDFEVPAPEGLEYRPFQRAGVAYMANALKTYKGVVNGDDMGLGKTIQTCGLVNADPNIKSVLLICPMTLRINWKRETMKWLTRYFKIHVVEDASDPVPSDATFVIVNYDKLVGTAGAKVLPGLMARNWDLLVCDEAQYLKNPDAQRTQAVLGRN